MKNKKIIYIIILALFVIAILILLKKESKNNQHKEITSFEECVQAGFPVMESFPPQCRAGDITFTGQEPEEEQQPKGPSTLGIKEYSTITSPANLTGSTPGNWFQEAQFDIELKDSNGNTIAQSQAKTTSNWMTTDLVPWTTTLTFPPQPTGTEGTLILHKANPSAEPENDESQEFKVTF